MKMKSRMKTTKGLGIVMAFILILTGIMSPLSLVFSAESERTIEEVLGLDAAARSEIYQSLRYDPRYLYKGQIISERPYAVVTQVSLDHPFDAAIIRVWTGIISRVDNHLDTGWDELRLDRNGQVVIIATDNAARIEDYYAAEAQAEFLTEDNLGIFPWSVQIATDREAEASQQSPFPTDGIINYYGIVFEDTEVEHSTQQDAVKASPHIPIIGVVEDIPSDILDSWAQDYMVHLLREEVIQGYADGTIRPQGTLTRAEFIALLARSLGLQEMENQAVTLYADVVNHWAQPEVTAALQAGILPTATTNEAFRPNANITRIEMAEMIYRATKSYPMSEQLQSTDFKDEGSLTILQAEALRVTTGLGILSGYPDGTFQPDRTLTRAEAFKVISVIMDLLR